MAENTSLKFVTFAIVFSLTVLLLTTSASGEECFTIVVGKNASADGYVIMAHNEDDDPPQIVNHYKIPRKKHEPGEKITLLNGGQLEETDVTWACIWSEMPGMLFSDSYINEWGVGIASDACPSREDNPEITDGGISFMLRRIVAQRAKTAREGVLLAGELAERFGYDASGRTYIICDPDEGWLFCAVNGKHWLAGRVPDDEVAMIANTYSVREVNLADEDHFLASDDIIDYAVSRGWYDLERDDPFDFAAVYADPQVALDSSNFCRQWGGLRHIAGESIPLSPQLPFSVVPREKLGVPEVMKILRDHYEGTGLYSTSRKTGSPHEGHHRPICISATQTGFVVQLRRNMPLDIGILYWVCLGPPCTSVFLPFHFGIERFPNGFAAAGGSPSESYYEEKVSSAFEVLPLEAFWTFSNFHDKVNDAYGSKAENIGMEIAHVESLALALQKPLEEAASRLYPEDKKTAIELLTNYSRGVYLSAMEAMAGVISKK